MSCPRTIFVDTSVTFFELESFHVFLLFTFLFFCFVLYVRFIVFLYLIWLGYLLSFLLILDCFVRYCYGDDLGVARQLLP